MSSASRAAPGDGDNEFPVYVEAGGIVYPQAAREKLDATGRDGARGAETKKRLADRVREQFRGRFVMDIDGAEYTDNNTLLEDYRYDIGLIRTAGDEVCDSLKLLYRLNTRFDFQRNDGEWTIATDEEAMADEHYKVWSKDLDKIIVGGDYGLSTRLTNLLRDDGPGALDLKREECLSEFIEHLCKLLDQMVEEELVGLVVFGQDKDCDFHFFRDVVIESTSEERTTTNITDRQVTHETYDVRVVRTSGYAVDVREKRSTVRRTRQDIYLREIAVARFGQSRMPIPPNIHAFLTAIPEWLRDATRIVEGDRYLQQILDYEVKLIDWQETRVRPIHSITHERTHRDPALTLGHYVLAGWDGSDVADQRGQQEAQWQQSRAVAGAVLAGSYGRSVLLAAIVSLVLAMLALTLLPDAVARIAGAAGITVFMACAVGSFHFSGKARRKKVNGVHHLLAAILSGMLAVSMLCTTEAFRVGNWVLLWAVPLAPLAILLAWGLREVLPDDR